MTSPLLLCIYSDLLLCKFDGITSAVSLAKCLYAHSRTLMMLCLLRQRLVPCVACCLLVIRLLIITPLYSTLRDQWLRFESTHRAGSFITQKPVFYTEGTVIDIVKKQVTLDRIIANRSNDGGDIFTPFQTLNGVIQAGRVDVHSSLRSSVTKCTIMYREQTAEHESANCCLRMHIDKVCSPADFHSNLQRPWPSLSM